MKAKKLYFMECHLAGLQYHDASEVWNELKVGTVLRLVRDYENRYDPNAVAIVYERFHDAQGNDPVIDSEEFLLGYLPASRNETIAHLLEMDWNDIFECRISQLMPEAHYENQIRLTIRIKRNIHANCNTRS